MTPTPIPDAPLTDTRAYALTALALLSLSCLTLAAHLHTRWAWVRRLPLLGVHVLLMGALVAAGAVLLGPGSALLPVPRHPAGWWGLPAGAALGAVLGLLIVRVDLAITTAWRTARSAPARPAPQRMTAARPAGFAASGTGCPSAAAPAWCAPATTTRRRAATCGSGSNCWSPWPSGRNWSSAAC